MVQQAKKSNILYLSASSALNVIASYAAELKIVRFDCEFRINNGLQNFTMEMDSLISYNLIKAKVTYNKKLKKEIKKINQLMSRANIV